MAIRGNSSSYKLTSTVLQTFLPVLLDMDLDTDTVFYVDQVNVGSQTPGPMLLDPEGDVILATTPGEGAIQKVLVCSRILSLASPVFAKMLGPNFKEGQELRHKCQ